MFTAEQYEVAFARESIKQYRDIDVFESRAGYAINQAKLFLAARVLACPIKDHPMPLWQHGRVIYSRLRQYLAARTDHHMPVCCVDIGTAKGFSALMMQFALNDAGASGAVWSVDVINPLARCSRNTVAEAEKGPRTLAEILEPWPEARAIKFKNGGSSEFFREFNHRTHFAFLDGKHDYPTVKAELQALRRLQQPGDVLICDDYQIPPVATAIVENAGGWDLEIVSASNLRRYAIGVRANGH